MAELVHDAFETHHHAIVEAGTGTGKTLLILSRQFARTARGDFHGDEVAAGTASTRRIFLSAEALRAEPESGGDEGRANFLCISKLHQMQDQALLKGMEELDAFRQIKELGEIDGDGRPRGADISCADDSELWGRLDARRDTCTGKNCPSFNPCFVTGMHQRAQEADLIIVNHHLFLRTWRSSRTISRRFCRNTRAVVFDEAHEMRKTWPATISGGRFRISDSKSWPAMRSNAALGAS